MLRNDTILGVCEALGQDFGINPNWLRVAFCAPIYWNPAAVVGLYLTLGIIVAATRFAYPDRYQPAPLAPEAYVDDEAGESDERERQLIAA